MRMFSISVMKSGVGGLIRRERWLIRIWGWRLMGGMFMPSTGSVDRSVGVDCAQLRAGYYHEEMGGFAPFAIP